MTSVNTVSDFKDKNSHTEIDENKVKAPNMFERAKEEFDAVIGAIHQRKSSMDGSGKMSRDGSSKMSRDGSGKMSRDGSGKMEFKSEKPEDGKKKIPNMMRKAKDELKSLFQKEKPHRHHHQLHHHHHKETHGRSDDINENTPVDEVKAPNVFERAKEEIEAVIDTIHPKKKNEAEPEGSESPKPSRSVSPEKERAGLGCAIGKGLEKMCSPWGDDKKD